VIYLFPVNYNWCGIDGCNKHIIEEFVSQMVYFWLLKNIIYEFLLSLRNLLVSVVSEASSFINIIIILLLLYILLSLVFQSKYILRLDDLIQDVIRINIV